MLACNDQEVIAAKRMTNERPGGKVTQLSLACLTFDMVDLSLNITMGLPELPSKSLCV